MSHDVLRTALAILVLVGCLPAQSGRASADERVQVDLKNGSAIIGIAPAGRLAERLGRHGYEETADRSHRKTGIRVWYYRNADGFIFLPYRSVQRVKRLGALTGQESKDLRKAMARAELSRRERRPAGRPGTPGGDPVGGGSEPSDGLSAEERQLLKEFPPEQGFGPERYGEIQRKKIVLDLQPQGRDRRFVEVYPQWEKAWKKSRKGESTPGRGRKLQPAQRPPAPRPQPDGKGGGLKRLGGH